MIKDASKSLTRDVLYKLYIEEEKSLLDIAAIGGYKSPQTISNKLKKYNIPIRERSMSNIKYRSERIGMKKKNNYGLMMEIVEYMGTRKILVKFEQGEPIRAEWSQFLKGTLRSPYERNVLDIGYYGEGKYVTKKDGKHTPQYSTWRHMLWRVYGEEYQKKYPTYVGSAVSEEWLNFQTFAKWYDENIYAVKGERIELDKDIVLKGNQLYSRGTCIFAPRAINTLFTKRNAHRGELPIGVHLDKKSGKYVAQCMDGKGGKKSLGQYDIPEEAFYAYKEYKEELIKSIADEYRNTIPDKLYKALLSYEVDIDD